MSNEKLFVYGTLRYAAVQRTTFGRTLRGAMDELPGYVTSNVTMNHPHIVALANNETQFPMLHYTGKPEDVVSGLVLDITIEEIRQADMYEVDLYKRARVKLASGDEAWAYVSAKDGTPN